MLLSLLLTHDKQPNTFKDLQRHAMHHLTGADREENRMFYLQNIGFISTGCYNTTVCEWKGCTCTDGFLTKLVFPDSPYLTRPHADLKWFPSTLKAISATDVYLNVDLSIRHLPRELERITLLTCALRGSLEMDVLPQKLVCVEMRRNFFEGTIVLRNLPSTFRFLDLQWNHIRHVFLDAARFPHKLKMLVVKSYPKDAHVHWMSGEKQRGVTFCF